MSELMDDEHIEVDLGTEDLQDTNRPVWVPIVAILVFLFISAGAFELFVAAPQRSEAVNAIVPETTEIEATATSQVVEEETPQPVGGVVAVSPTASPQPTASAAAVVEDDLDTQSDSETMPANTSSDDDDDDDKVDDANTTTNGTPNFDRSATANTPAGTPWISRVVEDPNRDSASNNNSTASSSDADDSNSTTNASTSTDGNDGEEDRDDDDDEDNSSSSSDRSSSSGTNDSSSNDEDRSTDDDDASSDGANVIRN